MTESDHYPTPTRAGLSDHVLSTPVPDLPRAACAHVDPELWHPEHVGPGSRSAGAICVTCPERAACLEFAMSQPTLTGIWGGTTYSERRELRRAAPKPVGRTTDAAHAAVTRNRLARVADAHLHAARGTSPTDIARLLGVTPQRVREYLKETAA